jgi:hypothetical protein
MGGKQVARFTGVLKKLIPTLVGDIEEDREDMKGDSKSPRFTIGA